ncbi:MAG: HlyD family efflux transporter periplasmic adaptor subunit [Phycisphaeraceae bacterium]
MTEKRRRLLAITTRATVAVAVLVVAVAIYVVLVRTAPKEQPTNLTGLRPQVAVFQAKQVPVSQQWRGYGTVEAMDSADVPARVTATVERIADGILAGKPVHKDQLLVKLDESDFLRQVEMVEQTLADLDAQLALVEVERRRLTERLQLESDDVQLAKNELNRQEQIFRRGAGNQQGLDRAKRAVIDAERTRLITAETLDKVVPRRAQLEAQRAGQRSSLQLARQNLQRCSIVSPIDGVLQTVDVEVGEQISNGQRIARVVNLNRIEVPLRLPAAARAEVAIGDRVTLTATNQTGLVGSARVSRIAPEDDPATRTVTVFLEVDQHEAAASYGTGHGPALLTPGTFVAGVLTSDRSQIRWVVPRRAVRSGRILLVQDAVVHSRPVRVDYVLEGEIQGFGLPDDQWAVLDENPAGLSEGELVVINASSSVSDGEVVEPVIPSGQGVAEIATSKETTP